jgi:NAD(P)-dependent dehydrogenase (short-subunit alcohol dehydrogenase family)
MPKTILVTGATRGLGLETCLQLLKHGHTVIAAGRNTDKLEELENRKYGDGFFTLHMDVTDDESVYDAFQEFKSKHGKLDVLINNAGIAHDSKDSSDVTVEALRKTLNTNLNGPIRVSQNFLPLLYESTDGRIINVSSGMGAISNEMSGSAAYRISKSALNSLTAIMSSDLNNAIKVVAVCPGWVNTDMGGGSAPRSVSQGAKGIVDLAIREELHSGLFYRDGEVIPW